MGFTSRCQKCGTLIITAKGKLKICSFCESKINTGSEIAREMMEDE